MTFSNTDQPLPVIRLSSGAAFESSAGQSILEAAANSSVMLPHSCKTGRCSSCRCKALSGKTRAMCAESGLTEQEKSDGWILSCVRTAESDCLIEVEDLSGIQLPPVKTFPCKISQLARLTEDVLQVRLRLPPAADFSFIPGQYIDLTGPGGIRRSYSLANASAADKSLELHIRQVAGGAMSEYWFGAAKVNDLLRFNGPLGTFFLRNTGLLDLVFLATGTGMAPVKAMLESIPELPATQRPRSVTVLWGGRHASDLYFDPSAITPGLQYVPVVSRADADWSGARGYVQQVLLARQPDLLHTIVCACGSEAMIRDAKNLLTQSGLPANRFYSDAFVCSSS